jgi:hydroxymethylbilane synthase
MTKITIGSRGSDLAIWQANHVKAQLEALGCEVEIKIIKTQGDIIQHLSFDKMEGKGFFTKEIEAALLDKSIDLAVHSHKDLETNSPEGLIVGAVSEREDPADLLLIRKESVDSAEQFMLKSGGVVGTSSARRKSQMMRFRPDVEISDLRGNVPTRIQKLRDGNYDAILLAYAGVSRLEIDLSEFEVVILNPREFIPAPAQGVLGLQIREEDTALVTLLQQLDTPDVRRHIGVERAVLNQLDGGCQLPLGVYCPDDHHVYVSFSTNWEEGAIWEEYQVDDLEGVAELIVQDLKEGLQENQ